MKISILLLVIQLSQVICEFNFFENSRFNSDIHATLNLFRMNRKFEVSGPRVIEDFKKHVRDIEEKLKGYNFKPVFKVNLELKKIETTTAVTINKRIETEKITKSYKPPLKTVYLKPHYKDMLNKLARQKYKELRKRNSTPMPVTTTEDDFYVTKVAKWKYNPFINHMAPAYHRTVEPVKNRFIVLDR